MAFIGNDTLIKILSSSDVVSDFDLAHIKNGAYEMSLGAQVFQTDSVPRCVKNLSDNEMIAIQPGQFALLLTKEYVKIPKDKIAFISIKAGVKFKGLINVSGFHVDPGFEGNLLFSVYNAGPSTIILSNNKPYFPIWFAELNEVQEYNGKHEKQVRIPDEPIEALSQGDLASPNALSIRIDENNNAADKRISVLERDQKANNYIRITILGVVIAILLKVLLDWVGFVIGYNEGIKEIKREISRDSIIKGRLNEEKLLLREIDSLKRIREKFSNTKN